MSSLDTLIFFFLALFGLSRDRGSASTSSPGLPTARWKADEAAAEAEAARQRAEELERQARAQQTASQAPLPWPQAAPSNLPAFPGGWEYDEPPSAAVRQRAWQLLDPLWKQGKGSKVVELTAGRWTTFRAEITKGGKRGVVAYRMKRAASTSPAARPAAAPSARSPGVPQGTRTSSPAPAPAIRRTELTGKPWLHQGAGMGTLVALAPAVSDAQRKLASAGVYSGQIDGKFGPKTKAAVEAFQRARGLQVDGIVGDNTWQALDAPLPPMAWNVQVQPAQLAS